MEIKIDAAFKNLIFPLTPDELNNLETSILKYGCRDPLVLWNGILIDGHHRYSICKAHHITFKTISMKFGNRAEVSIWIIENQLARRNCTPEAISYLRGLRYRYEKLEPHRPNKLDKMSSLLTSERLAKHFKVNSKTIQRDENFADAVDLITKAFPPKSRLSIKQDLLVSDVSLTKKDILELSTYPENIIKKVIEKYISIDEARIEVKRQQSKKELRKVRFTDHDIQLIHGDCIKLSQQLKPATIHHIITDPPYSGDQIECWSELGKIAARLLKPGGFLITYSGKLHLHEVFRRLSEHLQYYWQLVLLHSGKIDTGYNPISVHPRQVNTMYKPILVFFKPPQQRLPKYFNDVIKGSGIAKDYHNWQQSDNELQAIFEIFTKPGQTILDPFAGASTTLLVAKRLKRKAIGYEIDKNHYQTALQRLAETQWSK